MAAAVVTQESAGQATLQEGLNQAMNEVFNRASSDVPLSVTTQSRPIIEHRKQRCGLAAAACGYHMTLGRVKITVPQAVDVPNFKEPSCPWHEIWRLFMQSRLLELSKPIALQKAANRCVTWQITHVGLCLPRGLEIVVQQLRTPSCVPASQLFDHLNCGCG